MTTSKLALDFIRIPEGEFVIGSDLKHDSQAHTDETPQHRLHITTYYIQRYPVTNGQYRLFVEATGARPPLFWDKGACPEDKLDHPVVGVSFHEAVAFCRWARLETGLPVRLPSEPEWEKAARGSDGRLYPWGNTWEPGRCNSSEARLAGTSAIGQFSPAGDSIYGVAELAGNVQEWISSLFAAYPYDPEDGRETLVHEMNPPSYLPRLWDTGGTSVPESMEASLGKSMLRGGSWRETKFQSRCAYRSWAAPMHRSDDTGFRLAYEA